MLSYAFRVLNEQGYKNLATEKFHNVAELCAAILVKGVSLQLKRGLGRDYITQTESLSTLRGRIEISESVKTMSLLNRQLICSHDEFSVNSYMNRIFKTTMEFLLRADISKVRKKQLKTILVLFAEVEPLAVHAINWNVQYNRNNQTCRMLISICRLTLKGLLQTNADDSTRLMDFFDEQRMCRLYEKFILEYYRKEFKQISASPAQIPWVVDDGIKIMLPLMQSDIMLAYENKILIIDAKYYSHTTQARYNTQTLHSNNLYQIFTYVKNKALSVEHEVSGMLLYARTDEKIFPNNSYRMSGNKIIVRTLDLNCNFPDIAAQLNSIATENLL